MGKEQGAKSCLHRRPQRTHDVTRCSQKDCRSSESTLGKVAKGSQANLAASWRNRVVQDEDSQCGVRDTRPAGNVRRATRSRVWGLSRIFTVAHRSHSPSTTQAVRVMVSRLRGEAVQRASRDSKEFWGVLFFSTQSSTTASCAETSPIRLPRCSVDDHPVHRSPKSEGRPWAWGRGPMVGFCGAHGDA